jgi:hypothetical protein
MSRDDHVFLIILQRILTLFGDLRLHTPNFCREREKYAKELEVQAIEYKTIIQHHLSVNNKLLKEKQALAEKSCNLAANLATAESKVKINNSISPNSTSPSCKLMDMQNTKQKISLIRKFLHHHRMLTKNRSMKHVLFSSNGLTHCTVASAV